MNLMEIRLGMVVYYKPEMLDTNDKTSRARSITKFQVGSGGSGHSGEKKPRRTLRQSRHPVRFLAGTWLFLSIEAQPGQGCGEEIRYTEGGRNFSSL
jgi:hypothetical protein